MVSSLREMNERRNQYLSEKSSSYEDFGKNLRFLKDDLIVFQFVANGDEGDKFIKVYRSHIIPIQGRDYPDHRYCPQQSGEPDIECPLCAQGHTDIKERMSMWFYVYNILHQTMPKDKQYPVAPYEGRNWFNEEVNDFKIWHASAWRDSPWADIIKNAEIYKGLHNFTANLVVVGEKLTRRFKFYALPNSAIVTPELYARAQEECEPIPGMLRAQVSSAVQLNPQPAQPPAGAIGIGPATISFTPVVPSQIGPVGVSNTPIGPRNDNPGEPAIVVTRAETEAPQEVPQPTPENEPKLPLKSLW